MAKQKRSIGHIKKLEGDKYLLRLSLGYDDFGKRIQPSKVVHCSSDREAERMLMDFARERERFANTPTVKIPDTLEKLYAEWTENHVKINLAPKTAEYYGYLWSGHLKPYSKLKIKHATAKNIYQILSSICTDKTKNAVFKLLKAIFNKAIQWGYMEFNPCDRIDTPKYKPKEKKTLSEKDIKRAMAALPNEEIKFQAIFHFAAVCGMRRQEIIALKWSDINFADRNFTIQRAATQIHGTGTITKDTKTDKSTRTLPMSDSLKVILLRLMSEQREQKYKLGDLWVDEDWVFTQWNGSIMCLQTPSHWWRDFAKANNIEGVTFHGLRHTAASYMIKNNVPISTVSGVLGHAQTSTTLNIYTHVIEDTKRAAIDVMANLLTENNTTKEKVAL